jgi:hypothetical protein
MDLGLFFLEDGKVDSYERQRVCKDYYLVR